MARRKGVSKSRHFGGRKINLEASQIPKGENKLKDDLVNTTPQSMDDKELISSKKIYLSTGDNQLKTKNYIDCLSHRNYISNQTLNEKNNLKTLKGDHGNTLDFINANNNNNQTIKNSSNDLKYLHKKFKRIASATIDEVETHKQSPINTNSELLKVCQEDLSKSNSSDTISINSDYKYTSINGDIETSSIRSSSLTDKEIFLTPDRNGDLIENVSLKYSNLKSNLKGANQLEISLKHGDVTTNNSLIKAETIPPVIHSSHNNVLNRITVTPSNFNNPVVTTSTLNNNNNNNLKVLQQSSQRSQHRELDQNLSGRHVCPYCNLNCTKPSVLQKHIRAHTNERPYPCDTCGFAFKTKSNYYKHCRSRSHALRIKGGEPQVDDDASVGSDQDQDPDLSNSSSDVISRTASPMDERTSSPANQQQVGQLLQKSSGEKPYKPKFHNAALYAKEEISNNNFTNQNQSIHYSSFARQQSAHASESDSSLICQPSKNRSDIFLSLPQTFQQTVPCTVEPLSTYRDSLTATNFSGVSSTVVTQHLDREFLQEHISKIISQNEAIVENKELLLQKKYPKLSNKSKNSTPITSSENSNSKLVLALSNKYHQQNHHQQMQPREEMINFKANNTSGPMAANISHASGMQQHLKANHQAVSQNSESPLSSQPLNLTKVSEKAENIKKRSSVDNVSTASIESTTKTSTIRSQSSERSIIKHLLLNARGLGVPNGEGDDAVYICPLCKMEFRSAEKLRLHTSNYCEGGPSSAPISPVASPSYKYFRSNSISVNLPEINNPNSLAKLARSSLLHLSRNPLPLAKLAWSQLKTKPSNLVLNHLNINTSTTAGRSSSQGDNTVCTQKVVDTPLPSPGPLLGKTPLVEAYNSERKSEDVVITKMHDESRMFTKEYSPKRLKLNNCSQQPFHTTMNENLSNNSNNLCAGTSLPIMTEPSQVTSQSGYSMCGGEVQLLDKKEDRMKRFLSSGGCIIPISECPDIEVSPKMIRTPLLSGGSFTEVSSENTNKETSALLTTTPKIMIPISSLTSNLSAPSLLGTPMPLAQHFQFPPINPITAFNPLTLPPVTIVPSTMMHGDKTIPFVPGIPGPNSLSSHFIQPTQLKNEIILNTSVSPNRKKATSPHISSCYPGQSDLGIQQNLQSINHRHSMSAPIIRIENEQGKSYVTIANEAIRLPQKSVRNWSQGQISSETNRKSFNFTRIADNLSPRKSNIEKAVKSSEAEKEVRYFNFDNLTRSEVASTTTHQTLQQEQSFAPLHVDVTSSTASEVSLENETEVKNKTKSKFLRPTSLPLKPGTFTPKRHHGITPTANTLPLISPETPRPSKACIQLYLNGHAYTYLGLKCSTKMFYCTVNCPQPSYVGNLHKLSMYSVWQVCAENNPHPLGLKPKVVMSLYDSRQRSSVCTIANINSPYATVNSQSTVMTPFENSNSRQYYHHLTKSSQLPDQSSKNEANSKSASSVLIGGYESNEDYTYIRGRGRGRYVCSECGIRCKKPSMLKKHIRTHTDVRPYTCQHCAFSFKTKGNLTKHMQSKTHYKKCLELGINPGPMPTEGDYMETDGDTDQQSTISGGGRTSSIPGESDSDDYSDGGDGETESSDTDESKSRLPEHEAARCLLSLSMTPSSHNVGSQMCNSRTHYSTPPQQISSESLQSTNSINNRNQEENIVHPYSAKRVISFTPPKPPFDYQKQEQYYSNPNIVPKGRDDTFDEACTKPIDLRKPRQIGKEKVQEIIGTMSNETRLLKSLVSITDKIRNTTETSASTQKLDDTILLQAYLTEQALKYTKIKQSQMNKQSSGISTSSTFSTTSPLDVAFTCSYGKSNITFSTSSQSEVCETTTISSMISTSRASPPCSKFTENISSSESESNKSFSPQGSVTEKQQGVVCAQGEMKTDTDSKSFQQISSQFAQTSNVESVKESNQSPKSKTISYGTGGAKSVASEYLKMTSAEYMKSRNSRTEESEESSSDQEINVSESGSGPLKSTGEFGGVLARTVIVGEDGFKSNSSEVQPVFPRVPISDDGRPVCTICSKTFQKQHQMVLHMNIHYMERKFKCEPCAVSFRTQGHLQKHERSEAHKNKVMMTSTFGIPTTSNPRPFECSDCKIAFRIHGHLAKHLRSKTHVQKLECLQKLPFGTYAEIERAGISLTEIDTTDCDNSLASLKALAQKLIEKDPNKLSSYVTPSCMETNSSGNMSHESSGEDNPDGQADGSDINSSINELSSTPPTIYSTEGSGVKRKFDSFSSCSNDSTTNITQQDLGFEKRPRTTSET